MTQQIRSALRIRLESKPTATYRRALKRSVLNALQRGRRRVVFDCAALAEMDLILLSYVIGCARECDARGVAFELDNLDPEVRSKIQALSLDHRLGL